MSIDSRIDEWLRLDKNPDTRNEILELRQAGNLDELEKRMRNRIEFGTAGLRGKMEAGWTRMNDLTVIQASQGLCKYVLDKNPGSHCSVVIGHDHRYNSDKWASLAAAAFVHYGVTVFFLRGLVHTPMVPFAVKHLNASAGVMITASHNPKHDNGYKVYWSNAVQIISPHDQGIAKSIEENLEPITWDIHSVFSSPLLVDRTTELIDAYFSTLSRLSSTRELNSNTHVRFVNTSMHGVGHNFVQRAFETFGFPSNSLVHVAEQQTPDPEFTTVAFPNPEEKGALDLAIATADRHGLHYVLAQDPDADRFSAAERGPEGWVNFTGDQLGTLFAAHVLDTCRRAGKPLGKIAMIASTVSSKMIESMANIEGFTFNECLTGFKFIGNTALNLVQKGYEVPFGYEEAIGFMFGDNIRDKDGVAASVLFAEFVTSLHKNGKTVQGYLSELYGKYGYFETSNSYFICNDPAVIDSIFSRLRQFNGESPNTRSYPPSIAEVPITRIVDLTVGYDSGNPDSYEPSLPLSSGHMIQFRAGKRAEHGVELVLTLRTSGTEPKIKYYLEGSGQDREAVKLLLSKAVSDIGQVWLEASKHNLKHG